VTDATRDPNLPIYNRPDVVAHYAGLTYLTLCEQELFQTFLHKGMAVLDLGVGGGRTTPYLSSIAGRYVGVDYAEEMITACQRRFATLEFRTANAADLSLFSDESFDAVIMAFNAMDYVIPDEARFCCLREIRRVLTPKGVLIFSSHNPRAVFVRPSWSRQRLRAMARSATDRAPLFFCPVAGLLTSLRVALAVVTSLWSSLERCVSRIPTRAFWVGEGYLLDSAHGTLRTHCAVSRKVEREVSAFGFQLLRILGDDYPSTSFRYATDWYYYVFAKAESAPGMAPCD
jgi:ubiquinone/menaquinone biosynthesis C-methylase UbiE